MIIMVIERIKQYIKDWDSFLLSWGAWSWKTYTLMEVLDFAYSEYWNNYKIACITFTKAAVKEIKGRSSYEKLWVSTIHEFLWDIISPFQNDLKQCLKDLIEKEKVEEKSWIKFKWNVENIDFSWWIKYKEYLKIEKWIISHDEVIKISNYMFNKYPLLARIVKDKFDLILIDEFQDTESLVIDIFLGSLYNNNQNKPVIWFFWDSMQSIYWWVWNLDWYWDRVKNILKEDNWRCSKNVIELINKIRDDKIVQEPKWEFEEWNITFLYWNSDDIETIKQNTLFSEWDFNDTDNTKELYLTHNLISKKQWFDSLFQIYDKDRIIEYAGKISKYLKDNTESESLVEWKSIWEVFELWLKPKWRNLDPFIDENIELWNNIKDLPFEQIRKIYLDKDKLIEWWWEQKEDRWNKKDNLIKHLWKIQICIDNYEKNNVFDFLKTTEYKIQNIEDRKKLKKIIDELINIWEKTIYEIIEFAHENWIILKDEKFDNFIEDYNYIYERVKKVKYKEFKNLYDMEEWYSPYSTQHGIKGAEFRDVLVVLDNWLWNKYNFKYLFENKTWKESIIERTKKIFYVSCSRAKRNLVVYFRNPDDGVLLKAKEWFGDSNVINI